MADTFRDWLIEQRKNHEDFKQQEDRIGNTQVALREAAIANAYHVAIAAERAQPDHSGRPIFEAL